MKRRTLPQQLFLSVLPIIFAVLLIVGGLAFYSCRYEINYVYDSQLVNNANVLWMLVADDLDEEVNPGHPKRVENPDVYVPSGALLWRGKAEEYGDSRMFRIWRGTTLAMLSDTAFPETVPPQPAGFNTITYKHDHWRVFTLVLHHENITIEMGEKLVLRNELIWNILLNLFVPLLVLVPLIGLALWRGIKGGLSVTRHLVTQIQSRSPDDLSPVGVDALPRDLAPLGHSINKLFSKLAQSISAERRFADHAAHQLRTPLAGSKLLIQMFASADSDAERRTILEDLALSNDQAEQLVKKMLIAARVSHQPITLHPVNLYDAVARAIAVIGTIATAKRLEMMLDGEERSMILADETLLVLMLDNIIDNAIKYTAAGGTMSAHITDAGDYWQLAIVDSGPGISDAEKVMVFQRFYRSNDVATEGSGLGLTIVADIVERFGGTIALTNPDNGIGLCVTLRLPKAH